MQAPRLPAMFSLFRQRPSKGFNLVTRYYDPEKEERQERLRRVASERDALATREEDRRRLSERIRHSWHREGSEGTRLVRLILVMGMVMVVLFFIVRSFSLLDLWNG